MPRTVPEGWVSHRVDRGGRRASPVFFASPDRRGERPLAHLAACSGALVADGDAGFNAPYEKARPGGLLPVRSGAHSDPSNRPAASLHSSETRGFAHRIEAWREASVAGLPRRGCAPLPQGRTETVAQRRGL